MKRDVFYFTTIALLTAALVFAFIDAGRARDEQRSQQLLMAAQSAAGTAYFSIPVVIEAVSAETRTLEYSVYSKKLGSMQRFRARVSENTPILEYVPDRASDGTIVNFRPDAERELDTIVAGTPAIAHFSVSADNTLLIDRIVLGITSVEP